MLNMPDKDQTLGIAWERLFKLNQILIPLVLVWAAWATDSIYELKGQANIGERFTATEGVNLELRVKDWVRENYPPKDIQEDIKAIRLELEAIRIEMAYHERDF